MFKIYVRAIIENSQKQILLIQKKSNQKIAAGKWLLPGGTVEFGEAPTDSLKREVKEETNLNIENCILIGTEAMIIADTHWLGLYYRVTGDFSDVKNLEPDKHEKIEWSTIEFAKANLTNEAAQLFNG